MRINPKVRIHPKAHAHPKARAHLGVTLIETILVVVILAIALMGLLTAFRHSLLHSNDPAVRIHALEKGQAMLDQILSRKFASNTPTGGVPACSSSGQSACAAIATNGGLADVGSYQGYVNNTEALYPLSVTVVNAGADLGLSAAYARLITVTVGMPGGTSIKLSAYKVNF